MSNINNESRTPPLNYFVHRNLMPEKSEPDSHQEPIDLEQVIANAKANKIVDEARKAKAEADKMEEEVLHEKEKRRKTEVETSNSKSAKTFDSIKAIATIGTLVISATALYLKAKDK